MVHFERSHVRTSASGIFVDNPSVPRCGAEGQLGRWTARTRSSSLVEGSGGQATKGIRWMPWHQEVMKDVVSCEKPRGAETSVDPWISEWENPHRVMPVYPMAEYIGRGRRTGRSETSQYPQERKSTETPLVVASERGPAQTACV